MTTDMKTTRQWWLSRLCCKTPGMEKLDDGEWIQWMEPALTQRGAKTSSAPVGGKDDNGRTEPIRAPVGEEDDCELTETSQTQTSSTVEGRTGLRFDTVQEEGRTGSQLRNGARDEDAPEENSKSARRSVPLDHPDEPKIENVERSDVDGARDEGLRPAAVEPIRTKTPPRGLRNWVGDELVVATTKEEKSKAMQRRSFALDTMDRLIREEDPEKHVATEARKMDSFPSNNALFDGAAATAHDEEFHAPNSVLFNASDSPFFNRNDARRISVFGEMTGHKHAAIDGGEGGGERGEGEDEDDFAAHGVRVEVGALMAKNLKVNLNHRGSVGRRDSATSVISDVSDFWNKKSAEDMSSDESEDTSSDESDDVSQMGED